MQRRASYPDSHVNPAYTNSQANPFVASQMQHVPTHRMQHMCTQRMQLNAAMKDFPGRPDSFSTEEEHSYKSSKIEQQWKWDRVAPNVSNQTSPHSFNEVLEIIQPYLEYFSWTPAVGADCSTYNHAVVTPEAIGAYSSMEKTMAPVSVNYWPQNASSS